MIDEMITVSYNKIECVGSGTIHGIALACLMWILSGILIGILISVIYSKYKKEKESKP